MTKQSLLGKFQKQTEFKIFFNCSDELIIVTLSNQNLSIRDAITYVIQKLNLQRQLGLVLDQNYYELYGARKSGKKKDDLPAFDKAQLLKQTCLKNFYLMPIYYSPKLQSKDSTKSIQTQISLNSKSKNQKISSTMFGCFCLRKGSML